MMQSLPLLFALLLVVALVVSLYTLWVHRYHDARLPVRVPLAGASPVALARLAAARDRNTIHPAVFFIHVDTPGPSKRLQHMIRFITHELQATPQHFHGLTPNNAQGSAFLQHLRRYRTIPSSLRPGEIGCFASHCALLQRIADDAAIAPDTFVMVMEDDVVGRSDMEPAEMRRVVWETLRAAPAYIGMVQFGTTFHQMPLHTQAATSEQLDDADALQHHVGVPLMHAWGLQTHAMAFRRNIAGRVARLLLQGSSPGSLQVVQRRASLMHSSTEATPRPALRPVDVEMMECAQALAEKEGHPVALTHVCPLPKRSHSRGVLVQDRRGLGSVIR